MKHVYFTLSIFMLCGCAAQIKDVKPWEKNELAKDTMTQSGGNNLFSNFQNHIYFSKEASKGGSGVAGGGCGCN